MAPDGTTNSKVIGADALNLTRILRDCFACAVLVVDRRGQIRFCTPAAEQALRWKLGKAAKAKLTTFPKPLRQLVQDCFAAKETMNSQTISLRPAKHARAMLSASAVLVGSGRTAQVVVVLNDFSPLKHFEQNLRRLDRLASVGTLSAGMAHEIKNALVAVKTFVDLLAEKGDDAELTQTVGRELQRMDAIVRQMLKFVGPTRSAFAQVRVHESLDHALRLVQRQIDSKLISLDRRFNAAADTVRGDDFQLEQAFVNLLLNALEAMGTNGALTVSTEVIPPNPEVQSPAEFRTTPHIRVSIHDTGVGITAENMARLFEPFFTTKQNGTGLGLAICQRIVHEHHGSVSVQSEPNKGTAFHIFLPAFADDR